MQQPEPQMRTADALALAGLSSKAWDHLVSREHFTAAPPTTKGVERMFSIDDVVALFVIRHYTEGGTGPAVAGRVGALVRKELPDAGPEQEFFWIAHTSEGVPHVACLTQPPNDIVSMQFPLAMMRQLILDAVQAIPPPPEPKRRRKPRP